VVHIVDEAAEAGAITAELAERMLDVLIAVGIARRDGDGYVAVDGVRQILTDEGVAQLRAELRATLRQSGGTWLIGPGGARL
jgi:hypothetical protein